MFLSATRAMWPAAFFMALGAVTSASVYKWLIEMEDRTPVMVVEQDELESTTIKAGDNLHVRFVTTRYVACQAVTHRFIIDDATDIQMWSSLAPSRINMVGEHQKATVFVKTPEYLPPGNYRYQAFTYNTDCPRGRSSVVIAPTLHFMVVE